MICAWREPGSCKSSSRNRRAELAPSRFARLEELFSAALELEAAQRDAFLAALEGEDRELRAELEGLLAVEQTAAEARLGRVVAGAHALPADEQPSWPSLGTQQKVGPYRIIGELGRGGLGTVFLAERDDHQYSRRVALKVVRQGMESEIVLERLRRERQILAELDHPNIARLYDGGATAEGVPYFAMEVIDGQRIDSWCASTQAPLRRRLELMRRVCDAVHYAHRSLVLHRDLKPSNILVNQAGEPKLLDFGIAKILDADEDSLPGSSTSVLADAPTLTESGNLLLTPEFASPEQARGESLTTASDVYSLGVLLYLLVTGKRPYELDRRRMGEAERVICTVEPPRPSEVARRHPGQAAPGWSPAAVGDDLDNILAMALRKEPGRRYGSAADLAEDLRCYLEDLPVHARADTAGYRLRKFTRRHRWGVAGGAAFLLLLLTTVAITSWQAKIAKEQRARAEGVASFLLEVFRVSDPYETLGEKITAREILDRSTARIKGDSSLSPDLRASLLETMGKVYQNLSLYGPAGELLEEARKLQRSELGVQDQRYLETSVSLARLEIDRGRYADAEPLLAEVLARPRSFWDSTDLLVEAERLKANVAVGLDRFDEAEALLAGALSSSASASKAARAEVLESLGDMWLNRQEPARAQPFYEEALALREPLFGPLHPEVLNTRNDLALSVQGQGRLPEAEAQFRQLLHSYIQVFGERHATVSVLWINLAFSRLMQRDPDQAETYYREALTQRQAIYGENHPAVAEVWLGLARCAQMRSSIARKAGLTEQQHSRDEEARGLAQKALAIDRVAFGEEHLRTLRDLFLLAELASARHDRQAEEHFAQIAAVLRAKAPGDPRLATALIAIGRSRLEQGKTAQAEEPLREAITILEAAALPTAEADAQLAFCLEKEGRAAEALQLAGSALTFYESGGRTSPTTLRLKVLVDRLGGQNP